VAYIRRTTHYGFPYISDDEILSGIDEETAALIIDNQLRAGILGAGGTRVYQNGTFVAAIVDEISGRVEVTLSPRSVGLPSVQGIASDGLIEVFDPIVWTDLAANTFYYLYVQATASTYEDPGNVNIISSDTPITSLDHLLLATLSTTDTDADPAVQPVVDVSPPGKPTAFNLFQLLNNNHDPFGPSLTQSVLTVLSQFSVILERGTTALFQQLNPDASLPVITIENVSGQPEISSSGQLRLADAFIPAGFAFSDEANSAYQGIATSLVGALNELLTELLAHINNNQDPHGEILYQTSLVLGTFLEIPQLRLHPPAPAPPTSPPAPPYYDILSSGELRLGDSRGGIALTENGNTTYDGIAISLIGALNELLGLINALAAEVGGISGTTLPAVSPVVFEIVPEELGIPLHFKITVSEAENFSNVIATKESRTNVTGWFYEAHPPAPPLPPSPPPGPATLPGAILVPDPPPPPEWVALPADGLGPDLQLQWDGRPTRVKYEPQSGDGILSRHRYTVGIQEYNGEYGDTELAALTFG
jgi:hypothetical protein